MGSMEPQESLGGVHMARTSFARYLDLLGAHRWSSSPALVAGQPASLLRDINQTHLDDDISRRPLPRCRFDDLREAGDRLYFRQGWRDLGERRHPTGTESTSARDDAGTTPVFMGGLGGADAVDRRSSDLTAAALAVRRDAPGDLRPDGAGPPASRALLAQGALLPLSAACFYSLAAPDPAGVRLRSLADRRDAPPGRGSSTKLRPPRVAAGGRSNGCTT